MSKQNTNISELSRRYAKALFSLCKDKSELKNHYNSFETFVNLQKTNSDFSLFIKNPLISSKKKIFILEKILNKLNISGKFSNFLKIVAQHNKLLFLQTIFNHFKDMIEEENNETNIKIISVSPIQGELKKELILELEKITGKKVNIVNLIDKDILGGIIIRINSLMIDFSIKTKLDNYQFSLKGTI